MPRIKTTRTVTIALWVLRIYLLGMLLIILTKFVSEARRGGAREAGAPAAAGQSAAPPAGSQPGPKN